MSALKRIYILFSLAFYDNVGKIGLLDFFFFLGGGGIIKKPLYNYKVPWVEHSKNYFIKKLNRFLGAIMNMQSDLSIDYAV